MMARSRGLGQGIYFDDLFCSMANATGVMITVGEWEGGEEQMIQQETGKSRFNKNKLRIPADNILSSDSMIV
jgi:hypothetical protein